MMKDLLTKSLRKAEKDVDEHYKTNPLLKLPRSVALWYLFAQFEEIFVREEIKSEDNLGIHAQMALSDTLINSLKWSAWWLYKHCSIEENFKIEYNDELYKAAGDLMTLSNIYLSFESAFSYASWGFLKLKIEKSNILTSGIMRKDSCYDAYDRMYYIGEMPEQYDHNKLIGLIRKVKSDNFPYKLNPKLIKNASNIFSKIKQLQFDLPLDWEITDYSIGDYRLILRTLWVISVIHYKARLNGCSALAYKDALVVMGKNELINRLSRYTKLERTTVQNIINDITLGHGRIRHPDPALQPIFEFTPSKLAWAPNLIINSALERNLVVLLNRIPKGRDSYSRLSNYKEKLLQDKIKKDLHSFNFRYWNGNVPNWEPTNDIDLAIISDDEKCCLLLELKSFIWPAEPREIIEKSKEIAHGISQVKDRMSLAKSMASSLYNVLKIDKSYSVYWTVASKTSIGACWAQDDDIPVIEASHLVNQIQKEHSLRTVCNWLISRAYLPIKGKHYEEKQIKPTIGKWTLEWYGIQIFDDLTHS